MKSIEKKKLANKFFLFGWVIFMISYVLLKQTELMYMYNTSSIYQYVKFLIIIIFLIKIIFIDKYSRKKLFCYFVIFTFIFVNAIKVDNNTLFFSILIALSADNIDFEKFIKTDIKIRILLLITIVGLSLLGVFPNFMRYINGTLKQGFGFLHPNILCFFIITILLEIMYLTKKISFRYIFANILIIYLLTVYCFSRTSVYSFIVIFIANILIKNKERFFNNKLIKRMICLLPLLLSIFSLLVVIGYGNGNKISIDMDHAFTERIKSSYVFYKNYGITLLGNRIETIGTRAALYTGQKTNIFDMGYFRLLIGYGFIIALIVVVLLCLLQKKILNKKDYKLLLISTFFILTGFAENNIYNIIMNFTLICIPYILNKNNEIINKVGDVSYE